MHTFRKCLTLSAALLSGFLSLAFAPAASADVTRPDWSDCGAIVLAPDGEPIGSATIPLRVALITPSDRGILVCTGQLPDDLIPSRTRMYTEGLECGAPGGTTDNVRIVITVGGQVTMICQPPK